MSKNYWTVEDLGKLRGPESNKTLAVALGRTEAAIRGQRQRMQIRGQRQRMQIRRPRATPQVAPTTFVEDKTKADGSYWKEQHRALKAKYDLALKQGSVVEQLVGLATDLAPKGYDPRPNVVPSDRKHGGSSQSAVLLLSDTHVGQVITEEQTLGFGKYDFSVFLARLKFLENGIISILQDHTNTKLDELVICLGGDMIHGNLNHGAEAAQHSTLFEQVFGAGHALAQFIRNVSTVVPKVRIYSTVGNHPRWANQHKGCPSDNRYSNLDLFLSSYVEALTKDLTTVQWFLDKQPFTLFDVQGFRFLLSHGDSLRGGDRALGIPNHAVGRAVSSMTQLFGKHGQELISYYLVGHLHRSIVLPHAKGEFIINGGFPGLDGFGLAGGFAPIDATQSFFLMHKKFGKTASYAIQLKFAEVTGVPPYDLPKTFLPE